jgi:hypothetical protein
MIHIFFVPGMFGSTIEHVLRSFTVEYKPTNGQILSDGSMHSFNKEFHPTNIFAVKNFNHYQPDSITTPIYPFKQSHLPKILDEFSDLLPGNQSLLIYADSLGSCELNMLFQYHKIATGFYNKGLDIFCGENAHNVISWNPNYQTWHDMSPWEIREWLSLFYSTWTQEWVDSHDQVPDNFLRITNLDILFNTKPTLLKIISFCNLTYNPESNIDQFISEWQSKQQYIVDEFNLLNQILDHTLNNTVFEWDDLNIISESIIQQRLRVLGYEILCDGLNVFPKDSISLYNLLKKC